MFARLVQAFGQQNGVLTDFAQAGVLGNFVIENVLLTSFDKFVE